MIYIWPYIYGSIIWPYIYFAQRIVSCPLVFDEYDIYMALLYIYGNIYMALLYIYGHIHILLNELCRAHSCLTSMIYIYGHTIVYIWPYIYMAQRIVSSPTRVLRVWCIYSHKYMALLYIYGSIIYIWLYYIYMAQRIVSSPTRVLRVFCIVDVKMLLSTTLLSIYCSVLWHWDAQSWVVISVGHDSFHLWDMTHIFVGRDSFICGTWLVREGTWLNHMWDMSHSYVGYDSFICETWLIHVWDMTYLYVGHDLFMLQSHIYVLQSVALCCSQWRSHVKVCCSLLHMCDRVFQSSVLQCFTITGSLNLYCVAVCCSVLQCVAACCSVCCSDIRMCRSVFQLQCVAVCCSCSVLQCLQLQCVAVCSSCSVLQCVTIRGSLILQCVAIAVCCRVLQSQCVAVCSSCCVISEKVWSCSVLHCRAISTN